MTDKKLTLEPLKSFIKAWLPNYEKRKETFFADWDKEWGHYPSPANCDLWFNRRFHEALEAFARHIHDQACEKQRVICEMQASAVIDKNDFDQYLAMMDALRAILNAPSPEFKLTEKE